MQDHGIACTRGGDIGTCCTRKGHVLEQRPPDLGQVGRDQVRRRPRRLAALVIGIVLVGCWPLLTPLVATRHSLGFRLFFATAFGAAATFATAFALAFAPDFALGLAVAVTTRTSPGAYSFHLTRGGQQPQMFIHERARRYCQVQILH